MSAPIASIIVDQDSPDAAILNAFEMIRQEKVWVYSYDDGPEDVPEDEADQREHKQIAAERVVYDTPARTPAGVAAKLLLESTGQCDRWYDRVLAEFGMLAANARIDEVAAEQHYALSAALALIRIEWDQALARHERSNDAFMAILDIDSLVTKAGIESSALTKFLTEAEIRFTDNEALQDLIRTLAPDHAAMQRKVEIATAEGVKDEALPWIARDATFLLGPVLAAQAHSHSDGEA